MESSIIDLKSGEIYKNGKTIELTKNEFFILSVLVKSNNEIISRHELMKMLWDDDQFINDNTLTANITRLRQKLSSLNLDDRIVTKKRARIYGHYTIGGSKLFIAYLVYKKSWIGLIVILLLLTNTLILFDAGIRVEPYSIIYLNGLFLTIFVVFFCLEVQKRNLLL